MPSALTPFTISFLCFCLHSGASDHILPGSHSDFIKWPQLCCWALLIILKGALLQGLPRSHAHRDGDKGLEDIRGQGSSWGAGTGGRFWKIQAPSTMWLNHFLGWASSVGLLTLLVRESSLCSLPSVSHLSMPWFLSTLKPQPACGPSRPAYCWTQWPMLRPHCPWPPVCIRCSSLSVSLPWKIFFPCLPGYHVFLCFWLLSQFPLLLASLSFRESGLSEKQVILH